MADKNAADLTEITTLADDDKFIVVLDSNDEARIISKANVGEELLGSNVTEADLDKLADVTASAAELNVLDGVSGSLVVADVNLLAGQAAAGLTGTELGYVNGVTSAIQTQIDGKATLDNIKFRPYMYSKNFTASGTNQTFTNSTILTSFGLSAATSYIVASAFTYSLFDHSAGSGGISKATTTNVTWTESLISGSTYEITAIDFASLTNTSPYSIAVSLLILPRP